MTSTLYRNGVVHSPADPFAEAVLVADGRVAWLGAEDSVHTVLDGADEVVDLDGALVTPAFVDAHVHLLETGLALGTVDLGVGAGVRSLADALDLVAAAARRTEGGVPVLGHGWDETAWPEGRPPTRAELDRASGGAPVHLMRVDVHSAVVSTAMAHDAGCVGLPGWREDGLLTGQAHERARASTRDVGDLAREGLYRRALGAAAAAGVVAVHEHSSPSLDTRVGLALALALTADAGSALPLVVGYRAEACRTVEDARELLAAVPGLTGIGGDLTVDGSLGSRTAALREPYADAPGSGALSLDADAVEAHLLAVTAAGAHAAFHAIGDRALDAVLAGTAAAAAGPLGVRVRGAGHRVEHAELLDDDGVARLASLGLTASVQPAFDHRWGGPDGMYAQRLGRARAARMNPFAALAAAGVPMALGSDSPVTPLDPWGAVLAAVTHRTPEHRISARAAFRAHTRGGWRAAGLDGTGAGEVRLGAPAHLAVWEAVSLAVQAPDARRAWWSTDQRAGTPLLPELGADVPAPRCLRMLRDGVVVHDALG
ncbi:amidohydrolase [Cellulomonas carbonis]|uniref:Hydrolase n=1 Tax=Cellulomonas carbonis T26 TaxID=947969 RepID=A0A0A0BX73_9CELL|nr:amidohydrolase family protein [Cellulomonas carbonis]KGM11724.1 hydrolase [Cellulomonas carbonis T26]